MSNVFLFPGQGVQYAQMYNTLNEYRDEVSAVFEEASDETRKDVIALCEKSSAQELSQTENTQIAILTMNMAYYRLLINRGIAPDAVAGHSLGQYSALIASGCLSFRNAIRLVNSRAQMMSKVHRKGCLYLIMGLDEKEIKSICSQFSDDEERISIALYNTPSQIIVGGDVSCVEKAIRVFEQKGALRIKKLAVSQAFHTHVMFEMVNEFSEEVQKLDILSLQNSEIVLNSTGYYADTNQELRAEMIRQCTMPVLWTHSMQQLTKKYNKSSYYEVGPGRALSTMMRQIDKKAAVKNLDNLKHLKQVLNAS